MKKALMNASVASMICKFNMGNIELLEELGYQVDVACNFGKENPISEQEIKEFRAVLQKKKVRAFDNVCPRSPLKVKSMWAAYKQLKKLADEGRYDLVHTQSPIGGIVCRLAFRKARKRGMTKVIYQAHGFHFYKGAPLFNWLVFYPAEKLCARFTDVLVTISKEDYELAKRRMRAKRVEYVPGVGMDISVWKNIESDREARRQKLGIPPNGMLLLSVGELNVNKNHETIIRALAALRNPRIYYAVVGQGELLESLRKLIRSLDMEKQILLLGYQNDIPSWMKTADVYCHPSYREGLPVALMEAMSAGLPVVCSRIRGNTDLAVEGKGGFLCPPSSPEEFARAIQRLADAPVLRHSMGEFNAQHMKKFDISQVRSRMKELYKSMDDGR